MSELLARMEMKARLLDVGGSCPWKWEPGAAGCVELDVFCALERISCRCVKVIFLRKKMWNGLPYCLQNLRQEMEQAFDALAVYDTRPSAENCHVMGWWCLSQSNGSPSDHPLPRTYTKLYMVNEQPFFDSITGPFQCHGARSCFLSCGYAQTKNRTYAAYNSWLTIMSSLY